jgi:GDP-L-fucose synthase
MPHVSNRAGMAPGAKVYVAGHRGRLGSALGFREPRDACPCRARSRRCGGGARLLRPRASRVRVPGRGQGRGDPGKRHVSRGLHPREPIDRDPCHRRGQSRRPEAPLLSRLVLHLPARLPPAHAGGVALERSAGADQPAYAIAKIAGIELCWTYNRQHGTRYLAVMPANLYGPGTKRPGDLAHPPGADPQDARAPGAR